MRQARSKLTDLLLLLPSLTLFSCAAPPVQIDQLDVEFIEQGEPAPRDGWLVPPVVMERIINELEGR